MLKVSDLSARDAVIFSCIEYGCRFVYFLVGIVEGFVAMYLILILWSLSTDQDNLVGSTCWTVDPSGYYPVDS